MATVEPGNKKVFGTPSPNSSSGRCEEIVNKTKELAFPSEPILSLENFGMKGQHNSVAAMENESGKDLQESYRAPFSESAKYHEKVSDR